MKRGATYPFIEYYVNSGLRCLGKSEGSKKEAVMASSLKMKYDPLNARLKGGRLWEFLR